MNPFDRTRIFSRELRCLVLSCAAVALCTTPNLSAEFIFERAPFAQCHASTIAESADGTIVAAWFGGTLEKHPDVGIWISSLESGAWGSPREVATGVQYSRTDGTVERFPTWNPVLFQAKDGPLMLFYKVGPTPETWWGMLMKSFDGGQTWQEPERLPEGVLGPIKNKPVSLPGGVILCPSSREDPARGWTVHLESTRDMGRTWQLTPALETEGVVNAIQPSVLLHAGGSLQLLCRTKEGCIATAWSRDSGRTWSSLKRTILPNPNSGTDAVTLSDGRYLLVYNPTTPAPGKWGGPRTPLIAALSSDGVSWRTVAALESEPGEYSYPAVIQAADGRIHVTYTWQRTRIRHVILDRALLDPKSDSRAIPPAISNTSARP